MRTRYKSTIGGYTRTTTIFYIMSKMPDPKNMGQTARRTIYGSAIPTVYLVLKSGVQFSAQSAFGKKFNWCYLVTFHLIGAAIIPRKIYHSSGEKKKNRGRKEIGKEYIKFDKKYRYFSCGAYPAGLQKNLF